MFKGFHKAHFVLLIAALFLLSLKAPARAQDKPKGPPPARITVTKVETGRVVPQAEFIGTVFYKEVSDLASEVSGLVEKVLFQEGRRVKKGQILVVLVSDLLKKNLQATTASYEQVLSELEIARINLKRKKDLFQKKSIAQQLYDDDRFRVIGLEKQASSLRAQVERIRIELRKKMIRAPFDGIVIERHVELGEWVAEGKTVAVVARDDVIDMRAEVPEKYLRYIKPGMEVQATVDGKKIMGTVFAIVPRGNIATRTFPVKIRARNNGGFVEGMSARITLPTEKPKKGLIVPRDAVVSMFGKPVIFAVRSSRVSMMEVSIVGYEGLKVGISAAGLKEGMLVALKGNSRLRDGQAVTFASEENRKTP